MIQKVANLAPPRNNVGPAHDREFIDQEIPKVTTDKAHHLNDDFINKLIHTAGHDLRSPLFVMKSYSQLLQQTQEKEKLQRGFKLMSEATLKMENIISELVSLVDAYSLPVPVENNASFEEALNQAKFSLCNEIAEFDPIIKSDFGFHDSIQFPTTYLKEILIQTIDNSMRHNANQENLEIQITTYENNGNVVLEIADNGNNVPDIKDLKQLKEPFYSIAEDPKCVGMGLSKVQAIAQKYAERFEIEKSPTNGLICKIYFKQ